MNSLSGSIHTNGWQITGDDLIDADPFVQPEDICEASPLLLPNLARSDLTASDYSALEAHWIDRSLADGARLRRVDSMTGCEIVGRRGGDYADIPLPYFLAGTVSASTGCGAITQISNTMPPAT